MQFSTLFAAATLIATTAATYVSYDPGYDEASRPLTDVSCSDGPHGLYPRYRTQGELPGFPYIGGVQGITWGSPLCGSCFQLEYEGRTINLLAIDAAYNGGFNIGKGALDYLTNGRAAELGHVDVRATHIAATECGLYY